MLKGLFSLKLAEDAVNILFNTWSSDVVASVWHVVCVQPIRQQPPSKDFQLHGTFGIPDPLEGAVGLDIFEVELLVFFRGVFGAPRIYPLVTIIFVELLCVSVVLNLSDLFSDLH